MIKYLSLIYSFPLNIFYNFARELGIPWTKTQGPPAMIWSPTSLAYANASAESTSGCNQTRLMPFLCAASRTDFVTAGGVMIETLYSEGLPGKEDRSWTQVKDSIVFSLGFTGTAVYPLSTYLVCGFRVRGEAEERV